MSIFLDRIKLTLETINHKHLGVTEGTGIESFLRKNTQKLDLSVQVVETEPNPAPKNINPPAPGIANNNPKVNTEGNQLKGGVQLNIKNLLFGQNQIQGQTNEPEFTKKAEKQPNQQEGKTPSQPIQLNRNQEEELIEYDEDGLHLLRMMLSFDPVRKATLLSFMSFKVNLICFSFFHSVCRSIDPLPRTRSTTATSTRSERSPKHSF